MKSANLFAAFTAGFLAVFLSGCFNPISVAPLRTADTSPTEPFSMDILIGNDTAARSVAGPDTARIKGDIRNIIQLVVVDNSGNIIAFDEVRRKNNAETEAELRINSIPFGEIYHFLLLMGHWERTDTPEAAAAGGDYVYTAGPPTLLAVGLKEQKISGNGNVSITMWPVVVDTAFASGIRSAGPVVNAGKPGMVSLTPVNWDLTWTIKRGLSGNGLSDLVKAQKIAASGAGDTLLLKRAQTMVRDSTGNITWSNAALTGNVITRSIAAYTNGFEKIGTAGSVNFRLEYVPFNLTAAGAWDAVDKSDTAFDLSGGGPVWIIRNGVNDLAQNNDTDFNSFHHIPEEGAVIATPGANGNGAVRFGIVPKTPAGGSTLVVKNGKFLGPSTSTTPKIAFTTAGYENTAEVYYAVAPHNKTDPVSPPDYSDYTLLDNAVLTGDWEKTISLKPEQAGGDYDVYVIAYKDGEVSKVLIINTAEGGLDGDWIWGDEPYKSFYVASHGNDGASGTKTDPLATVRQALVTLKAAYTADASWPEKGTGKENPGAIIILDRVTVTRQIDIDGGAGCPPVILRDDPETPGGKLQAAASAETGYDNILRLTNGAKVTLGGGLILAGTGKAADSIRGVAVSNGTFTMNGGEIVDGCAGYGGGVHVNNGGVFILNNGIIAGNVAGFGGGVYVAGTFTMNGGAIADNFAAEHGGGVASGGTFTLNGGAIAGNSISSNASSSPHSRGGGGVFAGGAFTMTGGVIAGNSAFGSDVYGGGVYIADWNNLSFKKTGGTIYGSNGSVINNKETRNLVKELPDNLVNSKGHAVYHDAARFKDTTLEGGNELYYNDPVKGTSGWN